MFIPDDLSLEMNAIFNPEHMQDDFTRELRTPDFGFLGAKRLEDGTYVGIQRLITTLAICIGIDRVSAYTRRYCFQDAAQCIAEYQRMEKGDFVPEGWVARRPKLPEDDMYLGP